MSIFPVESQILCTFKKEKKSYFTLQFGNIRMNIRCIRKFYCFSFECSLNLPLTDTGHNILKGYELSFSCQNPRQTGNTPQHSTETPHLTNIASYHCPTPRDVLIQQGYLSAWRSRCHVQVGNGGGDVLLIFDDEGNVTSAGCSVKQHHGLKTFLWMRKKKCQQHHQRERKVQAQLQQTLIYIKTRTKQLRQMERHKHQETGGRGNLFLSRSKKFQFTKAKLRKIPHFHDKGC